MRENLSLVCLVRHGSTEWNAAGRFQGRQDVPLRPQGALEAERAGQALSQKIRELGRSRWDALYTSPLRRAVQTAAALSRWIRLDPVVQEDLVERAFGPIEGLTREEAERAYPGWWRRQRAIPGLEDDETLRARAHAAIDRLERAHRGQAIVVVSHGAFINAFLRSAGALNDPAPRAPLANGSLSIVCRDALGWRAVALNDAAHLSTGFPGTSILAGQGEV